MAVVAGLFDSEADATQVMDRILRMDIDGLESRVVGGAGRTDDADAPGMVFPVIPNTSGGFGSPGTGAGVGPLAAGVPASDADWFNDMDEEAERAFYLEGMKEGATLALVRVPDDHVEEVRNTMRMFGARTYLKD